MAFENDVAAKFDTEGFTADNWKHRSEGMVCRTCMHFALKEQNTPDGEPIRTVIGRCRRHAPTMNGFPVMYLDDWCGDHKLDENKV